MANTIWDVLDTDPTITISGSSLVLTASNVAYDTGARTVDAKNSGKLYFEVAVTSGTGTTTICGLCRTGATWSDYRTSHNLGFFVETGGTIYFNGSSTGLSLGAFAAGDVACFAIDFTNSKAWARKNNGNWNATAGNNPATNTGGTSISALVTTYALFCPLVAFASGSTAVRTANFGDTAFAQSVPAGFTAGWPANSSTTGATWDAANNGWPNLTNGNLRVSGQTGSNVFVRSVAKQSSGKYYFEMYFDDLSTGGLLAKYEFVGIGNSSFVPSGGSAGLANGALVRYAGSDGGRMYVNGTAFGTFGSGMAQGHTVSVAVDLTNNRIWFRSGGVAALWNNDAAADPTTNTNGLDISGIVSTGLFIVATNQDNIPASIGLGSSNNLKIDPGRFAAAGWTLGWPISSVVPALPIPAPFTMPGGLLVPAGAAAYAGEALRRNRSLSRRQLFDPRSWH